MVLLPFFLKFGHFAKKLIPDWEAQSKEVLIVFIGPSDPVQLHPGDPNTAIKDPITTSTSNGDNFTTSQF